MGNKQAANDIDFQDPRLISAIENWDVVSFFDDHNVDYSLEGKNIGRNFMGVNPCPFCGDSRNHFAVHQEEKFGSCFICKGYAHPIKLVSFFGRMPFKKAYDYLLSQTSEQQEVTDRVKQIFKQRRRNETKPERFSDPLPTNRLITYQDLKNEHLKNFFKKRKLHVWHIPRYQLRLCLDQQFRGFILFPMLIDHRPISYQLRHLIRKQYHNGKNLDKFIFNEENILEGKPVILVEGFLDFINVDSFIRCYYPGQISVVTGGLKSISNAQLDRLRNHSPSKLIVMFDGDSWFDYYRVKKSIGYDVDYVILDKTKDPNDLTWGELDYIFKKEIENASQTKVHNHAR